MAAKIPCCGLRRRKNIAVVMPSGNNKCYVNNRYGKDYFTFLTEELIEKCETWFDLSPKKKTVSSPECRWEDTERFMRR